jgi:hypothetical protein
MLLDVTDPHNVTPAFTGTYPIVTQGTDGKTTQIGGTRSRWPTGAAASPPSRRPS